MTKDVSKNKHPKIRHFSGQTKEIKPSVVKRDTGMKRMTGFFSTTEK